MKILVIEDKEKHRVSAKDTLEGHDLIVVRSFDEAIKLLSVRYDEDKIKRLASEKVGFELDRSAEWERNKPWWDAEKDIRPTCIIPFDFEVVLVDMMMPMSEATLAPGVFRWREEVPYGFVLALKAALAGAKYIAMVTDTNHHKGAMSASLDHLGSAYYREGFEPNFEINGAKVMFVHAPFVRVPVGKEECRSCNGSKICLGCDGVGEKDYHDGRDLITCCSCKGKKHCTSCKGTGEVDDMEERKDWGTVLRDLIGEPHPEKEDDE